MVPSVCYGEGSMCPPLTPPQTTAPMRLGNFLIVCVGCSRATCVPTRHGLRWGPPRWSSTCSGRECDERLRLELHHSHPGYVYSHSRRDPAAVLSAPPPRHSLVRAGNFADHFRAFAASAGLFQSRPLGISI